VSSVRYELGIISQKKIFFIITAMEASNLTLLSENFKGNSCT
jgi:hypothetical protein